MILLQRKIVKTKWKIDFDVIYCTSIYYADNFGKFSLSFGQLNNYPIALRESNTKPYNDHYWPRLRTGIATYAASDLYHDQLTILPSQSVNPGPAQSV